MDIVRQIRAEKAREYKNLDESQKPKVKVCTYCNEAEYLKEVCPETGIFHNLEKKTIIGGSTISGRVVESAQLMKAIENTRVRWVASRTQIVRADAQALNIFQSFVAQHDWCLQRYGILYGLYDEKQKTIEVHTIYEPEQHGNGFSFELVSDPRIAKVDKIANQLGLRRVGVVCTHPPRNPEEIVLNFRELLLCAREQSRFGDECVLLTIAPSISTEGVGHVECQAWQVSPQCVHFYRLNFLHERETTKPQHTAKEKGVDAVPFSVSQADSTELLAKTDTAKNIYSAVPLEIAQEETDEKGARRFITKAPSSQIDTRWFTSYIAVQQFSSPVIKGVFMRISRPGMEPPTFQNLRNYFNDPKRKECTFLEKLSDFHVLIFLSEILSVDDDIKFITEAIRTKFMSEEAKNYEAIINMYLE